MKNSINEVLDATLGYINENGWTGACFASSAINYVLLGECGIKSYPCLGVFRYGSDKYDHAWVEIEGGIYDVAITKGLSKNFKEVPSEGIRGNPPYGFRYGINMRLDALTNEKVLPFDMFMKEHPSFDFSINYWDVAVMIARRIGMNLDKENLIGTYSETEWHVVANR